MGTSRFTIVGLGEALFDVFPDAEILGGAPLNVAIHAHQLAQRRGGRGVVVSRVGQDALGDQIIATLRERGLDVSYMQTDPDHETGKVYVDLSDDGKPSYEIVENVAWDVIQFDPDLEQLASRAEAVCFGTLAQRDAQSRNTIYRYLDAARRAIRLFDVNLRQNYFDAQIIERSCERATAVKLNDEELPIVAKAAGIHLLDDTPEDRKPDAMARGLLKQFKLKHVIVTRGDRGTVIHTEHDRIEGDPATYSPADKADAVGAGDACSAAILVGLMLRKPLQEVANLANQAGAFVASQPGATPQLPDSILDMVG